MKAADLPGLPNSVGLFLDLISKVFERSRNDLPDFENPAVLVVISDTL